MNRLSTIGRLAAIVAGLAAAAYWIRSARQRVSTSTAN